MKVYHWTTRINSEIILINGLRAGSWICRNFNDWCGEVCLEIEYPEFDWNKMMYNWQATTHFKIEPHNIKIMENTK